jgi:hypothetical protein
MESLRSHARGELPRPPSRRPPAHRDRQQKTADARTEKIRIDVPRATKSNAVPSSHAKETAPCRAMQRAVTSRAQRVVWSAEVSASGEVFVDLRSRELIEPEALPAGATEGRARTERQLNVRFEPQPAHS